MTVTLIANSHIAGSTGGTTPGIDTTGAGIIVINSAIGNGATPTVTDSNNNKWNWLLARSNNSTQVLLYCLSPIVGPGHTFTLSNGGAIEVAAFSGYGFFLDRTTGTTGSNSLATGSVTPGVANSLLVAGLSFNASTVASINSSFAITNQDNFSAGVSNGGALAYLVQGASSAVNPTWTATASLATTIAVFGVIQNNSALNLSKTLSYDLLSVPNALSLSKELAFEVLIPPDRSINFSKEVSYSLVETTYSKNPFSLPKRFATFFQEKPVRRLKRPVGGPYRIDGAGNLIGVSSTAQIGNVAIAIDTTLTGVGSTVYIGNVSPQQSIPITGVESTVGIGNVAIEVDKTLTGVVSTVGIGTITVQVDADASITGVESTAEIGNVTLLSGLILDGVQSNVEIGTITVEIGTTLTGVESTTGIGDVSPALPIPLGNVFATAQIGTLTTSGDQSVFLTGVKSNATVGFVGFSPGVPLVGGGNVGVRSVAIAGDLHISKGPNQTDVQIRSGVEGSFFPGQLRVDLDKRVTGTVANVQIGSLTPLNTAQGLEMSFLQSESLPYAVDDVGVSMRYSDDKGASWHNARTQSFAVTGKYGTNVSFRRLGYARDRIFEVSWSSPIKTALTGVFAKFDKLGS